MISYIEGDATKPVGDVGRPKIIAHCCNNEGRWGSGFVVAISRRWRGPEKAYRTLAEANTKDFHKLLGVVQFVSVGDGIIVANIIGQNGVRGPDNPQPIIYEALEQGLKIVGEMAAEEGAVIHMPRLGAGLAGGSWEIIEEIIKRVIPAASDISSAKVFVYDFPGGTFNP